MNRFLAYIYNKKENENIIRNCYKDLSNKFNIHENINTYMSKNITMSNSIFTKTIGNLRYTIVFKSNIFNLKELKHKVKEFNLSNKTKLSKEKIIPEDYISKYLEAEILIYLYHKYKVDMLKYIDGYFSICIYEKNKNRVFCATDKLGIYSLYYSKYKSGYVFSSNTEEISFLPNFKCIINKDSILQMLDNNFLQINIFKNIFVLEGGHYIFCDKKELKKYKYYDIPSYKILDKENKTLLKVKKLLLNSFKKFKLVNKNKNYILSNLSFNELYNFNCSNKNLLDINIIDFKYNILNKDILSKDDIKKYITSNINSCSKNILNFDNSDLNEIEYRKNILLFLKFKLPLLVKNILNKLDNNNNIYFPYLDYRLLEYLYNIGKKIDLKDILKLNENYIFLSDNNQKDIQKLEEITIKILKENNIKFLNNEYIKTIIYSKGKELKTLNINYYDFLNNIINLNNIIKIYNVKIEI